jgi:pimeloyl-ACP methyl ester carboxylesterase
MDRGRRSVSVDLPSDDPEAGLQAYASAIAAQTDGIESGVVLVAHSLSGLVAPLVAALRPVTSIVYLAAFIPLAGQSMADQFATSPEPVLLLEGGRETDDLGRSRWTDEETTARLLYPDLSADDAQWAFGRLRPQAQRSQMEPHPAGLPEVPACALIGSNDRLMNLAWFRRVARERLGVEPEQMPAGHFPMITSPDLLAARLIELTQPGPR